MEEVKQANKEALLGTSEQILAGIIELKKLVRYYQNEAKQNSFHLSSSRTTPEEQQYYAGRHEAYSDHIAETSYIIDMLEGTR